MPVGEATSRTLRASAVTSGPMPSPGMTASLAEVTGVEEVMARNLVVVGARTAVVSQVKSGLYRLEAARVLRVVAGGSPLGIHVIHRSEEHTSEIQSLMRNSYAVLCLKK